ncbi:MAG: sigma-54 dependent transcriptional regulator [Candidatus Oceanisphaera merdipullorum]|nr:sigma-54 dependent transcriptional regulator [Candidatus Oceanisphaera merdipullorum]
MSLAMHLGKGSSDKADTAYKINSGASKGDKVLTQSHFCPQLQLSILAQLCSSRSASTVLQLWACALRQLSLAERAEIYLLDQDHSRLTRHALADAQGSRADGHYHEPADYSADSLLSTSLLQNSPIHLAEPARSGRFKLDFFGPEHGFLTTETMITTLPIVDMAKQVQGVVLLIGLHGHSQQAHTQPLQNLGASFWQQYALHQQLANHLQVNRLPMQPASLPRLSLPQGSLQHGSMQTKALSPSYGLTGQSPAIKQLRRLISKALHHQSCVLITGETGTGKELVAQAIHHHGPRRSQPFLVQNCASIPEHLLESELFGYKRGAFTGADRDYKGLIRSAEGGTLFLDEIGDMPLSLQAKLLRVLQEKTVRPLGDAQSYPVDVRILAATHQDLLQMVERHSFRQDLYYRLAQFPIALAALRDRQDDIIEFIHLFSDEFSRREQLKVPPFSETSLARLRQYPFPGNIRELKNMVERTLLLHGQEPELQLSHLPDELLNPAFSADRSSGGNTPDLGTGQLDERLDYLECQVLEQVLHKYHGNQKLAAQELGLTRGAMNYRLKKHHINARDWRI